MSHMDNLIDVGDFNATTGIDGHGRESSAGPSQFGPSDESSSIFLRLRE